MPADTRLGVLDDAALVQRCLSGDRESFTTLVERFKVRVYNTCFFLLRSEADAEDVAQETFVRAYNNLDKYDPKLPFASWILAIARNLSINLKRHPQSRTIPMDIQNVAASGRGPAASTGNPETIVEGAMGLSAVQEAIREIQPEFREALALRYVQKLSYQEISDQLKVPMGTVKSRLFNGRERLIQLLTKKGLVSDR